MRNTISCTYPVQNAAYCTAIAANAGSSVSGKDCEAGRQHQSKCNCRSLAVAIQGLQGGEYPRDYRVREGPSASSAEARMLVNGGLSNGA